MKRGNAMIYIILPKMQLISKYIGRNKNDDIGIHKYRIPLIILLI